MPSIPAPAARPALPTARSPSPTRQSSARSSLTRDGDGDMLPQREAFRLPVFVVGDMADIWPAFDWADPLLLEASLSEDEKLVQASARGFAQARLMPVVRDMHRHETFDPALLAEMGSLGLLGSTVAEFGGVSHVAYGLIAREMEKVDSA